MIAGYIRVSTDKQARDGVSIEMQQEMIIKHALMIELIKSRNEIIFYIDDGYSASSLARPQMTKLIEEIKSEKINILFAYDLSRISRDIFDSNVFLNLMQKYNVIFKCLYDDAKMKSAGDRLNTNMKLVYNQYEREKVVERTNDSLKEIAEKGRYPIGGKVFFGYDRDKNKDIVIHPGNSKIVKMIFQMAKQRYSLREICDQINSLRATERVFYTYQIQQILNDKRYAGMLVYKGKEYNNIVPAIVSLQDQEDAAQYYRKWKFKQNEDYYYDDLIFCGVCGNKMTCTCAYGHTGDKYYYYLCSHCSSTISQGALDKYISTVTLKGRDYKEYKKELSKEYYKLKRSLSRLREKWFNKQLNDREFCSLAITIEDRIEEVSFKRDGLKLKEKKVSYRNLVTKEEKKEYIQTSFKKITVDPIKKIVISVEER